MDILEDMFVRRFFTIWNDLLIHRKRSPCLACGLGHTRDLTAIQAVIQRPRAASLPTGEGKKDAPRDAFFMNSNYFVFLIVMTAPAHAATRARRITLVTSPVLGVEGVEGVEGAVVSGAVGAVVSGAVVSGAVGATGSATAFAE